MEMIMMRFRALSALVVSAAMLGWIIAPPASASEETPGYAGSTESSVSGCPVIVWRLARTADGEIHGIAYYANLAGVSVVTGSRDADGNFQLTVSPTTIGAGPEGQVQGLVGKNGAIDAELVGKGCANAKVHIRAWSDLNRASIR